MYRIITALILVIKNYISNMKFIKKTTLLYKLHFQLLWAFETFLVTLFGHCPLTNKTIFENFHHRKGAATTHCAQVVISCDIPHHATC